MATVRKKMMIAIIVVFAVLFRHADCQTISTRNTLVTNPETPGLTSPIPPTMPYTGDMPGQNATSTAPIGGVNGSTTQFPPSNTSTPCTYSWYIYPNTNVNGGVSSPATNIGSCQSDCISNPDCTGVDWNGGLPINQQCYLIMWWHTQRNVQVAYGINHYDLVRTNCPGSNNNNNNNNNNNHNNNNYKNDSVHIFPDVTCIVASLLVAIAANVSKHNRLS